MADFGVNELNILASSGTPQIQSVDNLFLRVGTGSTVVIGEKDTDFNSPAPAVVDSANTTALNVGIVTANKYYGTFYGSLNTDTSIKTATYGIVASDASKLLIMNGNYSFEVNGDQFSTGDMVTFLNMNSFSISVLQMTSPQTYLYLAGTAVTGNRTIPPYSMATAVCYDGSNNRFIVSGTGVS